MLELTLVEVFAEGELIILDASVVHKSQGDNEENESSTDASRVGDELLRVLLKEDYDYHWNRDDDTPHTLDETSMIL